MNQKIAIYCALPCEAKAIVEALKLKKVLNTPFALYENDNLVLAVLGLGSELAACAVGYLAARYQPFAYVNVGIAGSRNEPLGSHFLIHKIQKEGSDRSHYPQFPFSPRMPLRELLTVSKPAMIYPEKALVDMEAFAFFSAAIKFQSAEWIHCIKIISDNEENKLEKLPTKEFVMDLIKKAVPQIEALLNQLKELKMSLPQEETVLDFPWHTTVTERHQLQEALGRMKTLGEGISMEQMQKFKTAKDCVRTLISQLQTLHLDF